MLAGGSRSPTSTLSANASKYGTSTHLKTLGKVGHFDASRFLKLVQVIKQLVRHTALGVLVAQDIVILQSVRHVVRVQECGLRRVGEAFAAEHLDVRPGDEKDGGAAEGRGGDGVDGGLCPYRNDWVGWQEGSEMLGDTDGSSGENKRGLD